MQTNESLQRVLVTGATGLVGAALQQLDTSAFHMIYTGSYELNLLDKGSIDRVFSRESPSILIHLASIVLGATSNEEEQFQSLIQNSTMNLNIFEASRKYKISRIITCLTVAMSEESPVTPETILQGPSLQSQFHYGYVHSKRLLHSLGVSYERAGYGHCVMLCPTNIYGIHDMYTSSRLIPSLYRRICEAKSKTCSLSISGDATRQLVYNCDVARIVLHFLRLPLSESQAIHPILIGNPETLSIRDIIHLISSGLSDPPTVTYDYTRNYSRHVHLSELPFPFHYTPFHQAIGEIQEYYQDKTIPPNINRLIGDDSAIEKEETILYQNDDFIVMKDPKHTDASFHYTAWAKWPCRCIHDLRSSDIPRLKGIFGRFPTSSTPLYFFHFPPNFWTLHLHIVQDNHIYLAPPCEIYTLDKVIHNLEKNKSIRNRL